MVEVGREGREEEKKRHWLRQGERKRGGKEERVVEGKEEERRREWLKCKEKREEKEERVVEA